MVENRKVDPSVKVSKYLNESTYLIENNNRERNKIKYSDNILFIYNIILKQSNG
jgi:hypothetical protein